jgi:hypothetical protein
MRISKSKLHKIIREERAKLSRRSRRSRVNEMHDDHVVTAIADSGPGVVLESGDAAEAVLTEMAVAASHMDLVAESLEAAVELLGHCEDPIACHKPLIEALEAQVEALAETVEAEVGVLKESLDLDIPVVSV